MHRLLLSLMCKLLQYLIRRMQEKYRDKAKPLYMCFVDLEKAFNRVPRKVMDWALRKKGLPEMLVIAVMSLYEGAKTKVRVGCFMVVRHGV